MRALMAEKQAEEEAEEESESGAGNNVHWQSSAQQPSGQARWESWEFQLALLQRYGVLPADGGGGGGDMSDTSAYESSVAGDAEAQEQWGF